MDASDHLNVEEGGPAPDVALLGVVVACCAIGFVAAVQLPWRVVDCSAGYSACWREPFGSGPDVFLLSYSSVNIITTWLPACALIVAAAGIVARSSLVATFSAALLAPTAAFGMTVFVAVIAVDGPRSVSVEERDSVLAFAAVSLILIVTAGRMLWLASRSPHRPRVPSWTIYLVAASAVVVGVVRAVLVVQAVGGPARYLETYLLLVILFPFVLASLGAVSRQRLGLALSAGVFASQLLVAALAWRLGRGTGVSAVMSTAALPLIAAVVGLVAVAAGLGLASKLRRLP